MTPQTFGLWIPFRPILRSFLRCRTVVQHSTAPVRLPAVQAPQPARGRAWPTVNLRNSRLVTELTPVSQKARQSITPSIREVTPQTAIRSITLRIPAQIFPLGQEQ